MQKSEQVVPVIEPTSSSLSFQTIESTNTSVPLERLHDVSQCVEDDDQDQMQVQHDINEEKEEDENEDDIKMPDIESANSEEVINAIEAETDQMDNDDTLSGIIYHDGTSESEIHHIGTIFDDTESVENLEDGSIRSEHEGRASDTTDALIPEITLTRT